MNPLKLGLLSATYGLFWVCINLVAGRLITGVWPTFFECVAMSAFVIASMEAVIRLSKREGGR